MTAGHSIFIIVLTVANIAGCLWLLWWTRRSPGEGATTDHTTGHVWDEDLRELNNPLPRWWLWLFIITVVFGVRVPGAVSGTGHFTGHAQLDLARRTRGAVAPQCARASRRRWRRSARAA